MINEYNPDESNQKWEISGVKISSLDNPDMVIDIADCSEEAGASLCTWEYNGGDNQHWKIVHLYVSPVKDISLCSAFFALSQTSLANTEMVPVVHFPRARFFVYEIIVLGP